MIQLMTQTQTVANQTDQFGNSFTTQPKRLAKIVDKNQEEKHQITLEWEPCNGERNN